MIRVKLGVVGDGVRSVPPEAGVGDKSVSTISAATSLPTISSIAGLTTASSPASVDDIAPAIAVYGVVAWLATAFA